MFCPNCGNEVAEHAVVCIKCGGAIKSSSQPINATFDPTAKSRIAYILLGIFLGGLGVHNFYAGYTGRAVAQLLICLIVGSLTCGIGAIPVWIWVIVEICTVTVDASGKPLQ